MKKEELIRIAESIDLKHDWGQAPKTENIYYCQAKLVYDKNNNFIVVRSYRTDVALFDIETGIMYTFFYYSATTCQHICKAMKLLSQKGYKVTKKVNLYIDSRCGKRKARTLIDNDFSSLIMVNA